jgi:hypothetical protein
MACCEIYCVNRKCKLYSSLHSLPLTHDSLYKIICYVEVSGQFNSSFVGCLNVNIVLFVYEQKRKEHNKSSIVVRSSLT